MEKKMEGNYYSISGLYGDNGKENGNYYLGFMGSGPLQEGGS